MKIAIGMVVRNLLSASPLTEFLDNAEKYGHPIDRVIVAYSHQLAPEAAAVLQSRTKLSLIRLQEFGRAYLILKAIGVPYASLRELLFCTLIDTHGLIPYGFNRNQVLMEAMFTEADVLIFVDSDVLPSVLRRMPDGSVQPCEVDFVGAHLGGMAMGADITSSDYSGYNILPPARFDGMTELLWGLHKEAMAEFWQSSMAIGGMLLQEAMPGSRRPPQRSSAEISASGCAPFQRFRRSSPPITFLTGRRCWRGARTRCWDWPPTSITSSVSISGRRSSTTPMGAIPPSRSF